MKKYIRLILIWHSRLRGTLATFVKFMIKYDCYVFRLISDKMFALRIAHYVFNQVALLFDLLFLCIHITPNINATVLSMLSKEERGQFSYKTCKNNK